MYSFGPYGCYYGFRVILHTFGVEVVVNKPCMTASVLRSRLKFGVSGLACSDSQGSGM